MKRRVERRKDGKFRLRLPEVERDLLGSLVPQLRELLTGDDPDLRRLFPPAYPDDVEKNREYKSMVHDELLEARLAALDTVEDTLSATTVDEDQLSTWMGAINDLRLVLGTKLDISEDLTEIDYDDPMAPAYAVYDYLTWLLGQIVEALAGWGDFDPRPRADPDTSV